MISHRQAMTLAATAVDFPLDASDRGALDAHVRECTTCRTDIAAYRHDAARLAALPPITPPAWVRGAIGRTHRPRPVVLLAAAALLLTASAGITLIVGSALKDARIQEVSPSVRPVPSAVASPPPSGPALPSGSPGPARTPGGPVPAVTAGKIPASLGGAQLAPGPDGGLYLLINAPQELLAGPSSRAVLALLDAAGRPRPGWPLQLSGWSCADPNSAERWLATVADGSTRLVCTEDVVGEASPRRFAFAFDPAGRTMPGWPVELPAGDLLAPPQVVGDELRVVQHEFAPSNGDGSPQPGAWWVTGVGADGTVHPGVRYEVPDVSAFRAERLGSDGAAYLLAATEIVALDVGGVRAGWPVTVQGEGFLSYPTIGPQGRVYVTQIQGSGASTHSQTLVFEPDGRSVAIGSAGLPMTAAGEWDGAGAAPNGPMLAADGTAFVVGDLAGRTEAYAIDPSGLPMPGWPYRLAAGSQMQGTCPPLTVGCLIWRTIPSVGPDDTLYLLLAAADTKSGGSIVAIAPDGQVRAGWPVQLPAAGAGFWSAVVGSDGTVYALAVEPSASRNSWTLYAIGPDGTVRARTPVVKP